MAFRGRGRGRGGFGGGGFRAAKQEKFDLFPVTKTEFIASYYGNFSFHVCCLVTFLLVNAFTSCFFLLQFLGCEQFLFNCMNLS